MKLKNIIWPYGLLFIFFGLGCEQASNETQVDLSTYQIETGFHLDVVAAEPLIEAPVAADFDEQGRLWVLELPGYMANLDADGENEPIGRIMILEDSDGNGQMDRAKPFLEGLRAARAFAHAYGGILYAEPPNLYWVENKNDLPGKKVLIDSTYVVGGNIEHQPNSLTRNIDNWWYSSKSQFRYRRIGADWVKEATSFRGQWGMTKNDQGHLFYNYNSSALFGDWTRPNILLNNPHHQPSEGIGKAIVTDQRVFPLHATAVNRGYIEGVLDEEEKLVSFTSTCGPLIYRGAAFPEQFQGNAFVCGPEANLVKRYILTKQGNTISGENAYLGKEFLASTDEAFRPVNLHHGPDGSIYVVDFHRGVIQHKVYMTAYLREKILAKGLDSVVHYGRILKISSEQKPPPDQMDLIDLSPIALPQLLSHENGWMRDRAQQMIVEQELLETVPALEKIIFENKGPLATVHALWTLEGLGKLKKEILSEACRSNDAIVFSNALHLLEQLYPQADASEFFTAKLKWQDDVVDLQLCASAGTFRQYASLAQLLNRHQQDTFYYDAALSGLKDQEESFLDFVGQNSEPSTPSDFQQLLEKTIAHKKEGLVFHEGANTNTHTDDKTIGLELYRNHCASCHGMDGHGITHLAPPIYHSEYIEKDPNIMISLVLHGLKGPIQVNGKKYELNAVMPGLSTNPEMTDEKIAALLTFIRHGYGRQPLDISPKDVAALRDVLPRDDMFTEEELFGVDER